MTSGRISSQIPGKKKRRQQVTTQQQFSECPEQDLNLQPSGKQTTRNDHFPGTSRILATVFRSRNPFFTNFRAQIAVKQRPNSRKLCGVVYV